MAGKKQTLKLQNSTRPASPYVGDSAPQHGHVPTERSSRDQTGLTVIDTHPSGSKRTERIVRTASELFLEHGFDNTSLDEVIRRAGGSKAHIYRKFTNKEELFLTCVEFLCEEVQVSITVPDVCDLGPHQGLLVLARTLLNVLLGERHMAFQKLILAEAQRHPQARATWFEHGPERTVAILNDALACWTKRGALRVTSPGRAAELLHDMLFGRVLAILLRSEQKPPSRTALQKAAEAAVTVFLTGIESSNSVAAVRVVT